MEPTRNTFAALAKHEIGPMLRLAAPLVAAELGWMAMFIVDTLMLGRVGAASMGAVSVAGILSHTVLAGGTGCMLGLDTLVSHAYGARRPEDGRRALINAAYLALLLSPPLMALVWAGKPLLEHFGINRDVLAEAVPFLWTVVWGTLPLLLYAAFRRYLQAENLARPVMIATITANAVNAAGNWVLIFGHLGFRPMGAEGSGWSTCLARVYLAAVLLVAIMMRRGAEFRRADFRPDARLMLRLFALGAPAAAQIVVEVGVFALVGMFIARLDAPSIAAHQIAMNCASATYMVALGMGSAAAVRVGHAVGRGDPHGVAAAGWTAIIVGAGVMTCGSFVFVGAARHVVRAYTPDPNVAPIGVALLLLVAVFQPFDGIQGVATGALRGLGDTRTPALCHLAVYWLIGLPLGWYLCFRIAWGAPGMWIGLCFAVVLIGSALLWAWIRRLRAYRSMPAGSK